MIFAFYKFFSPSYWFAIIPFTYANLWNTILEVSSSKALAILLRATYLERMIIRTFTAQATKCAFNEALPRDSHTLYVTNVFMREWNFRLYAIAISNLYSQIDICDLTYFFFTFNQKQFLFVFSSYINRLIEILRFKVLKNSFFHNISTGKLCNFTKRRRMKRKRR